MSGESLRGEFRRQVRERVLDAARHRTVERGWDQVRVGDLAVESGVSRPTLYREFGNKDGLGQALVSREAERFFSAIAAVLEEHDTEPAVGVAAATRFTLVEAAENPLLSAVLTASRTGDVGLLPFLTTRSESILDSGRALLATWLSRREPDRDPATVDETVDAVVRLVVSHIVSPALDAAEVGERMARLTRASLSD